MATPQDPRCSRWPAVGWWGIWTVAFIVSLLPPAVHHWRKVSDIIEPLRYSLTGFLPAELLFLRHLGESSIWIPVVLIGLLVLAVHKPGARNGTIAFGAIVTAVFSSIYCAYTLIVISVYLVGSTQLVDKQYGVEQEGAVKPFTRSESNSEGGGKPQPEPEGRTR